MRWTLNPPIVPGWYWHRDPLNERGDRLFQPKPVRVFEWPSHGPGLYAAWGGATLASEVPGEWAGPIPMPED